MAIEVANASGTAIQRTHYYPFGTAFAENSVAEQGKQPYKYNGKELDQMHGLNWYDYSARQKDDFRFTSVDPLAEKYYSISPYVYVMNNPLKFIDPTGMEPDTARVYVETAGYGHSWLSVGEGDNMTIYTYGDYNGTGEGILKKLSGKLAKAYNEGKRKETNMESFIITDITDDAIIDVMNNIISKAQKRLDLEKKENGTMGPKQVNEEVYLLDEYKTLSNNCTTFVSDVLNKSGSKAMETTRYYPSPTPMIRNGGYTIKERIVIPYHMRGFLNSKAGHFPIYKSYTRN